MTARQAPIPAVDRPQDLLESALREATAAGRQDLVDRLTAARSRLHDRSVLVRVVAGAHQDRTDLLGALRSARTGPADLVVGPPGPADAVLVISDAGGVLAGVEMELMQELPGDRPAVLLVVTAVDRHPRHHGEIDAALVRLRALGIAAESFVVSLRAHEYALAVSDPARAAASGIPALAARLRAVGDDAAAAAAFAAAREVFDALPASRPARPQAPGPRAPRRAPRPERAEASPAAPRPRADRPPWSQVLGDGFAAAASDIDFDLRSRVRAVLAEAERAIDDGDPTLNRPGFDAWLRQRLEHEARATCALVAERTAAVAAALTEHLGLPAEAELRPPPLPPLPDLLERAGPGPEPVDDRRPLAVRGRSLLMAAYGGVMMVVVLPRLAGLIIPAWMLVVGALGAAFSLGAAALAGERKRRLDRGRARARAAVRHATDGFLLIAGRHTRDVLRTARQRLRDDCAAHAAGLRPAPSPPPGEGATVTPLRPVAPNPRGGDLHPPQARRAAAVR